MEIKDVEKNFEEAAKEVELLPFSERWDVIKDEVALPTNVKKRSVKKWLPSVLAACAVFLSGAIALPIALHEAKDAPQNEMFAPSVGESSKDHMNTSENEMEEVKYYMAGDLSISQYTDAVDALYQRLADVGYEIVEVPQCSLISALLLYNTDEVTNAEVIKGCQITYMDDEENPTIYVDLQIYDDTVKYQAGNPDASDEVVSYTTNGIVTTYWLDDYDGETYVYKIAARYKEMNYYLEYISFEENVQSFLDGFFQ
ncbi:MAG: hypothetical protein IKD47_01465 [Clostridia bacterium]|nr:hypothetical protein [Clostridia bacterium]